MNLSKRIMLAFVGAALISGCSDDETPRELTLSGTVTGLEGSLTVTAETESKTLTTDGAFEFESVFLTGDSVIVSITEAPDLQSCEITSASSFTFANDDIDNLAIECTDLVLYSAVDDTKTSQNGAAVSIDVFANDTSEYAETFTLVSVTQPTNGTAVINGSTITYTPNANYAGVDTFTYVGTDGVQEDTGSVSVTVTQSVTLSGRVTDSPLAGATVTVTLNGQTYTTVTDELGNYELVIPITDTTNTERPELSAQGAGTQSYIILSSRLPSTATMLIASGEDKVLVRAESGQVQVTQLTTAENIQLESLAGDEPISDDNIQALLTEFDSELLLEMAAAIKLLVDNPDYALPTGFTTIEEFLVDEAAYNTMIQEAETAGALDDALTATLNDPEVAGLPAGVGLENYYGTYIINNLGSRYTGRASISAVVLTADGVVFTNTRGENNFQPAPLARQTDGSWIASTSRTSFGFVNYFTLVNAYGVQMDPATATALEAYLMDGQGSFEFEYYNDRFKIITSSDKSITVERSVQVRLLAYSFNYGGIDYTVPTQELESTPGVSTWLPFDSLKSGVSFTIVDGSKWIIPQIFDYNVDIKPSYEWGVDFRLESQLLTMSSASAGATSGTYTNDLTGAQGTWQLTNNGTALVLTTPVETGNGVVTVYYARKDQHAEELLATVQFSDGTATRALNLLDRGGMLDASLANTTLLHAENEMSLALVNMAADDWTENGPIMSGELGWQYGWHLAADKTLKFLELWCDDPTYADTFDCPLSATYWEQTNSGEGDVWATFERYVHLARLSRGTSPDCIGAVTCGGRFVAPVRVNGTTGIITILEMELVGNDSPWDFSRLSDGLDAGGIYQWIAPRINYWYTIPFKGVGPGFGPGSASTGGTVTTLANKSPAAAYKKVLNWGDDLGTQQ